MNIIIRNLTTHDVDCVAWYVNPEGSAVREPQPLVLAANGNITLHGDIATVDVGPNPSFIDDLKAAVASAAEALATIIRRLINAVEAPASDDTPMVSIEIANQWDRGLRVLQGSNYNEVQIAPGATGTAEGKYVEIRQLGI